MVLTRSMNVLHISISLSLHAKNIVLFLFIAHINGVAQEPAQILRGVVRDTEMNAITEGQVINRNTFQSTTSDRNGYFSISVRENDTVVFHAFPYVKKEIVIDDEIMRKGFLNVKLADSIVELDEVVLLADRIQNSGEEITIDANALNLPNSNVRSLTKNERLLYEATDRWKVTNPMRIPLNPIINGITGRTKKLRKRVMRDHRYVLSQQMRMSYPDSIFVKQLKIPRERIGEFVYFCEIDSVFLQIATSNDALRIWEFMYRKSLEYKKNYEQDE